MERTAEIKAIISHFNVQAKSVYRFATEINQTAVSQALDAADGDIFAVKAYINHEVGNGNRNLISVMNGFVAEKAAEKKAQAEVQKKEQAVAQAQFNETTALNFLGGVVTNMIAGMKMDEIRETVCQSLKDEVKKFIDETYGPITRKVDFQIGERKTELKGVQHSKFETVLKFVMANEPVFLTGPAGAGKNVICKQIADVLGLKFYFTNAVTQEYKLTGFTDAMGNYQPTQFYKAFKDGGVFMLDEMDASIPEVLNILNAALANRYFDFPAPIGYVEAHPDFRVIAAGNTYGLGADMEYVGRNQLDAATLDRFATVRIDYDARIEESCANGDADLLKFARAFRKATSEAGIKAIVSYRAITRMAKMSACMDTDEMLEICLIKSMEVDDLKVIQSKIQNCGKYTDAFEKILRKMETA